MSCAEERLWGSLCCKGNMWRRVFFDVRKTRQVNDFFAAVLSEIDFLHDSPVVVFLDRGHPRFWNFYSTIPVDVVRVKSYMNSLFDPARVVIRVTINKLYFVPEWLVSGVVGML